MAVDQRSGAKARVTGVSHYHTAVSHYCAPEHPAPICHPFPAGCSTLMDAHGVADITSSFVLCGSQKSIQMSKYSEEKNHDPFSLSSRTFPIIYQKSFIYLLIPILFIFTSCIYLFLLCIKKSPFFVHDENHIFCSTLATEHYSCGFLHEETTEN